MTENTVGSSNPLGELRNKLFDMDPSQLGLSTQPELPRVWGLLMEVGRDEGSVSLVVIADQTTSLYFPAGGGVNGAGEAVINQIRLISESSLNQTGI